MALQVPYLVVMALVFPAHGRGNPKELWADSFEIIISCLPTVIAVIFSISELLSLKGSSQISHRSKFSLVALLFGIAILIFATIGWYHTLWLDPHGTWP
jgi:hypothetical protein